MAVSRETRPWYIRQRTANGQHVQGPYAPERIRRWIDAGRVRIEMEFSVDGERWYPGAEIIELFPVEDSRVEPLEQVTPVLPPSPEWFRSFAESKQQVLALRQQMHHAINEAKTSKRAWRLWSLAGAFGASVALSSQYKKPTRAIAAAGTVFAMSKAYRRYDGSWSARVDGARCFGEAIDTLDATYLESGPHILSPLAAPEEDDEFLGLYERSLEEVATFHPVLPRKGRRAIRRILLLRASVTPTKRYDRCLLRSAWSLGTEAMAEIASALDQVGGEESSRTRRAFNRLHIPYTLYSGAGLLVSAAVLWRSATAQTMPASSLGMLAIVMTLLWGWSTMKFGRALAWQAALRPAVRQARGVGAKERFARWHGVLSTSRRAGRSRSSTRSGSCGRTMSQPSIQWAVPLPRSVGPLWVAALTLLLFLSG